MYFIKRVLIEKNALNVFLKIIIILK